MLVQVLDMALCLSVCLSVSSGVLSKRMNEWSWFFGVESTFHLSYAVCKGNSGISKSVGTSLWNFVPNSGLRKFCHGILIIGMCCRLSLTMMDAQSVINWTVVGQLS